MPACHIQYGQPPPKRRNAPRDLEEIRNSTPLNGCKTTKVRHLVAGSASDTPLLPVHESNSINSPETSGYPDRSASNSSEAPALSRLSRDRLLFKNETEKCEERSSMGEEETSHLLGSFLSRRESKQITVENVASQEEDIKNKQGRPLPEAQYEMKQEDAESEREFKKLPYDMQCYLRVLASETGKWPANGIREQTLCGSEMWVERESSEVAWKLIDWDPPPREVMVQFMQEEFPIRDQMLSLNHRTIVPRATEDGIGKIDLEARLNRPTEPRPDTDSWSAMESLAPVHSRSAPVHLRIRACQKRKRRTGIRGVSRTIRNWFATGKKARTGDQQSNENTRFSLKEFLTRPWRRRNSHDSGISLEGNKKRDHQWDTVGPRNERLHSAGKPLRYRLGSLSRNTCFGCSPF